MKNIRVSIGLRGWALILAGTCAIGLLCVPVTAPAGVPEDIASTVQDALNNLNGAIPDPEVIHFAYKPPIVDSVRVDATFLGFAFCDPPNPAAAPNPTPTPPFNAYGCQNAVMVSADVTPDETSADLTVSVSDFFLDFEYVRNLTEACFEFGGGTTGGDAYLVSGMTFTMGLELERVGGCLQASVVPGSIDVALVDKAHGFPNDTCLEGAWALLSGPFLGVANESAAAVLEALLVEQMTAINDQLCGLTPVESSTWGRLKSSFR